MHEGIDGLVRRLENVDKALMSSHLELLPGILIDVRAAENRLDVLLRREWNRTGNHSTSLLCSIHNLYCALIEGFVIISLQPDSNLLVLRQFVFLLIVRTLGPNISP